MSKLMVIAGATGLIGAAAVDIAIARGWRVIALAVILFLPIPLVNILPAAAITLMALGLAERDGLAVLAGYALAALTALLLAVVSSAIYAGIVAFFGALFGG